MLKSKMVYKYCDFVEFSQLNNWSVQYLKDLKIHFTAQYPLVPIKEFLTRNKTAIEIQDDVYYKRATIKIRNGGIFLRDNILGIKIGTKNQFIISKGQFLLSKIDARNGAFGVVPDVLDGGIITGNFWTFDVDYSKVNPHYLALLTTTNEFIKFCEQASNGTTNRHYLQEPLFLDIKVPLPLLSEQNKLVEEYTSRVNEYNTLLTKAPELEQDFKIKLARLLKQDIDINEQTGDKIGTLHEVRFVKLSSWSVDPLLKSQISPYATSEYKHVYLHEISEINPRTEMSTINNEDYISFIPMEDISDIYGEWIGEKMIKKEDIKGYTKFQDGDLLWARITPCMQNGKSAIVKNLKNNRGCGSTEFHVIRVYEDNIIPEFLHVLLRNKALLTDAQRYFTGSAGQQRVPASYLYNLLIPIPPIQVQEEIIHIYKGVIDNKKRYKNKANYIMEEAKSSFETQIFE
ncbi:MAG TPA: restriction endonuclease subunit S [Bacteroidaceae bacterium]|nr:restriction endonuclease subunit S [Bacteroidaceae bacterium]